MFFRYSTDAQFAQLWNIQCFHIYGMLCSMVEEMPHLCGIFHHGILHVCANCATVEYSSVALWSQVDALGWRFVVVAWSGGADAARVAGRNAREGPGRGDRRRSGGVKKLSEAEQLRTCGPRPTSRTTSLRHNTPANITLACNTTAH